ncbi:beta-N-acetylhexosaminidase [Phreatobacter aquaticus]|uniref:beta-N-acetylhexosaminidase n=1 Tax=Phreatobacter aquaticus TaxID=2570229 RepID=A0A4D7QQU6_9HYPH|nr:beta-N-acetylhexosaminidase [Phreatobacter aquaticus]QCK87277.1 beta-N-acetylhexosaminidase [Phreatobacter aquaticus]
MAVHAVILGCAGTALTPDEIAFYRDLDPWGLILFRRNCADPDQIRRLVDSFRAISGRADAPVLIDQEGGRVQRLGPPHWPKYPAGRTFSRIAANDPMLGREMARLGARLIAHDLKALGINVDCLPVLDVPVPGAHDIIGDRAYAEGPDPVAAFGRAAAEGLMAGGVLPVIKHIPGHGRAGADSHAALPVVDAARETLEATDFKPFRTLTDMPLAMTAHVVYSAIDAKRPATTSRTVMRQIIRGSIGYDGLVMTDDLSMNALSGTLAERTGAALAAGCDMGLHCNGKLAEMVEVASATPVLAGKARRRAEAALARIRHEVEPFDQPEAASRFFDILKRAEVASSTAFAAGHALSV